MEHFATAQQVWIVGLVFLRVASMVMTVPGLGETYVPPTIRLAFAFLLAACLAPVLAHDLPPPGDGVGALFGSAVKEILTGLMIGLILRMFMTSLATAGELAALQTTLAFAQTANPAQAQPATTLSVFLGLLGLVLVFDTGLHRMFIAAIAHSYTLFPPARPLMLGDFADLAEQTLSRSFALGVQLAAPILVFSLVFNVAMGLIGRVFPQFQIFFAATPLTLLLGLSVFALSLGAVGLAWTGAYESLLRTFV